MQRRSNTAEVLALKPAAPAGERELLARALPEYQVVREIGRGAMGIVFLARDVVLHRLVAIKVLRRELGGVEEHRARFLREARMAARLTHAGIVPIYTSRQDRELSYIVMKFVDGESLADRLRRQGRIAPAEAQSILRELALALHYAHAQGVIHRDLKAENIIIEASTGQPMLTDFGVAMLRSLDPSRAEAMHAFGTPHYMSPEQASGELDIDCRSDVYSLGVLGYYMVGGRLPFDAPTFASLAAKHINEPVPALRALAPSAPATLVRAIERCLRKEREDRWRSAREFADTLADARRRWWSLV